MAVGRLGFSVAFASLLFYVCCAIYLISSVRKNVPIQSGKGFISLPTDLSNMTSLSQELFEDQNGSKCKMADRYTTQRPEVDLRVIIITYNRPNSLWRLLESLDNALYGADKISIEIWIDRSKANLVHNETLKAAVKYEFRKGTCNVFVHHVHVGITGQWLMTWTPSHNSSEIAVILEDDLTVSPHFYQYLKLVHSKYRHRNDIYGFSLQGKNVRHSDGKCCIEVPVKHKVFLYPTLGTSGFSPKKSHWIKFMTWYIDVIRRNVTVPLIDQSTESAESLGLFICSITNKLDDVKAIP